MTFLRKKALEISSWVTWLAAPGCKEWAEGLEREVEFIESDWRALVWALGSTRVLLDRREAPMASFAEVRRVAKGYRVSFGNRFKPASSYVFWAMGGALLWFVVSYRTGWASLVGPAAPAGGCLMAISLLCYGYSALVYRAALWFRIVTGGVDLAATIGGLVALWQMRPVAVVFFAALLGSGVAEAAEAIFVRHTVQATRIALIGQPGHGGNAPMSAEAAFWTSWLMPVLSISFEAALFVYVWQVTRNRERTDGDVGVRPEPIRQLAARR